MTRRRLPEHVLDTLLAAPAPTPARAGRQKVVVDDQVRAQVKVTVQLPRALVEQVRAVVLAASGADRPTFAGLVREALERELRRRGPAPRTPPGATLRPGRPLR